MVNYVDSLEDHISWTLSRYLSDCPSMTTNAPPAGITTAWIIQQLFPVGLGHVKFITGDFAWVTHVIIANVALTLYCIASFIVRMCLSSKFSILVPGLSSPTIGMILCIFSSYWVQCNCHCDTVKILILQYLILHHHNNSAILPNPNFELAPSCTLICWFLYTFWYPQWMTWMAR